MEKSQSFARLRGGQGWIPLSFLGERYSVVLEPPPEVRIGSFWYRVQAEGGIKVRRGPSRGARSIKTDDGGEHFRFECGEFLRASEVCTIFGRDRGGGGGGGTGADVAPAEGRDRGAATAGGAKQSPECFAKLYRNSHIQTHRLSQARNGGTHRSLDSLACPGEWVQVYGNGRLYLEECINPPRIERHREGGWRYNSVSEAGVRVRRGPSPLAEPVGKVLRAGESVLVNERVTGHGERATWLRLSDEGGWVHDTDGDGEVVMIAHSLRHRTKKELGGSAAAVAQPPSAGGTHAVEGASARGGNNASAAYNAVISRLKFPSEPVSSVNNPKLNT